MVTHFEYDWFDTTGKDQYGLQPMTMNLATVDQDKTTGKLRTVALKNIDMSSVGGSVDPVRGQPLALEHASRQRGVRAGRALRAPVHRPAYSCASGAIGLASMNRYLDPTGATKPAASTITVSLPR